MWEWIFSFPSRSRILGINFFIPFPFPNFGNGFFSFPSRSRILGMCFFHSLPVPEFREWNYPFPFPFPNAQKSFPLTPESASFAAKTKTIIIFIRIRLFNCPHSLKTLEMIFGLIFLRKWKRFLKCSTSPTSGDVHCRPYYDGSATRVLAGQEARGKRGKVVPSPLRVHSTPILVKKYFY